MTDQPLAHDDGEKAVPKKSHRPPPDDREKNSRDKGAKYSGPGMFDRLLMNDNAK
jgi:hypothetical protein